jgi:molecular chaperone GrpE
MDEKRRPPGRIKVQDKRRTNAPSPGATAPDAERAPSPAPDAERAASPAPDAERAPSAPPPGVERPVVSAPEAEPAPAYLDDLRRLQAEFDNFRKRALREQTAMAGRASARLIEKLLPVLDNFEAAVAHGEGGPGVAMVHNQLRATLKEEGLEEIPAEGVPFDPTVHDAFEAHEDDSVDEPMSVKVLRRGYRIGGHVVRHAMVSVARPAERDDRQDAVEG